MTGAHLFRVAGSAALPQHLPPPLDGVRVRNVFRDTSGVLWAGTDGQGVFRWGKGAPQLVNNIHPYIRAFAEDRDGAIWIGTDGGYFRWRAGAIDYFELHQSIRAMRIDRAGDLWVGKDLGLSRLHQGQPAEDAITSRLRGLKVWAIHEDPEGGMWFGTRGSGLFRWKQGSISVYTTARGLASNSIYQILEDRYGWFWMSGPNGISSVSRHDLDRMAQDAAWVPAVKLYGASDGLGTAPGAHAHYIRYPCVAANEKARKALGFAPRKTTLETVLEAARARRSAGRAIDFDALEEIARAAAYRLEQRMRRPAAPTSPGLDGGEAAGRPAETRMAS